MALPVPRWRRTFNRSRSTRAAKTLPATHHPYFAGVTAMIKTLSIAVAALLIASAVPAALNPAGAAQTIDKDFRGCAKSAGKVKIYTICSNGRWTEVHQRVTAQCRLETIKRVPTERTCHRR
jgi:hypothetical protein